MAEAMHHSLSMNLYNLGLFVPRLTRLVENINLFHIDKLVKIRVKRHHPCTSRPSLLFP